MSTADRKEGRAALRPARLLRSGIAGLALAGSGMAALMVAVASAAAPPGPDRPVAMGVEDARRSVSMLAEFYRQHLLVTHTTYVSNGKLPAAVMTRKLFAAMTEKGWPEARWLSVNGQPLNAENVPRDAFERKAGRSLRQGEKLVELVERDRYRAVAAVPLTGACLKCHWGDKPSDYVGGISFTVALSTGAPGSSKAGQDPRTPGTAPRRSVK